MAKKSAKKAAAPARKGGIAQKRITVKGENPHKEGTVAHEQFQHYKGNPTVEKAVERGLLKPYMYMHKKMGLISVA